MRAEEESKIEKTVPGSSHFSYVPIGMEGIEWVSAVSTDFFPFQVLALYNA